MCSGVFRGGEPHAHEWRGLLKFFIARREAQHCAALRANKIFRRDAHGLADASGLSDDLIGRVNV